ncbi:hypothetical protein T484DRAFT_1760018, partial [Baffinella frigidus]
EEEESDFSPDGDSPAPKKKAAPAPKPKAAAAPKGFAPDGNSPARKKKAAPKVPPFSPPGTCVSMTQREPGAFAEKAAPAKKKKIESDSEEEVDVSMGGDDSDFEEKKAARKPKTYGSKPKVVPKKTATLASPPVSPDVQMIEDDEEDDAPAPPAAKAKPAPKPKPAAKAAAPAKPKAVPKAKAASKKKIVDSEEEGSASDNSFMGDKMAKAFKDDDDSPPAKVAGASRGAPRRAAAKPVKYAKEDSEEDSDGEVELLDDDSGSDFEA